MRGRTSPGKALLGALSALVLALVTLGAGADFVVDRRGLAHGPGAILHALFEATFLRIDVLTVDIVVDPPTQQKLRAIVRLKPRTPATDAEVTRALMSAKRAHVEVRYLRDVGLGRFLEEARQQLDMAAKGGLITKTERDDAYRRLHSWLSRIESRGFEDGDHFFYIVQGSSLRMLLVSAKGKPLIDVRITEPRAGAVVLASYLAPGHELRELLIGSLYR